MVEMTAWAVAIEPDPSPWVERLVHVAVPRMRQPAAERGAASGTPRDARESLPRSISGSPRGLERAKARNATSRM